MRARSAGRASRSPARRWRHGSRVASPRNSFFRWRHPGPGPRSRSLYQYTRPTTTVRPRAGVSPSTTLRASSIWWYSCTESSCIVVNLQNISQSVHRSVLCFGAACLRCVRRLCPRRYSQVRCWLSAAVLSVPLCSVCVAALSLLQYWPGLDRKLWRCQRMRRPHRYWASFSTHLLVVQDSAAASLTVWATLSMVVLHLLRWRCRCLERHPHNWILSVAACT